MLSIRRREIGKSFLLKTNKDVFPIEIIIEVTNRCNLRCVMCPILKMTRPVGDMTKETFHELIRQIKGKTELVYLHGLGEPLLHKNIFEMIAYCKEAGLAVGLSTNSMYLDKYKAKELIHSGLDYLLLPLDSATKETYEKIRVNAKYEKVIENIRFFLQLNHTMGLKVYTLIQMIYQASNKHEKDMFYRQWRNIAGLASVRIKPVFDLLRNTGVRSKNVPCFHIWRQANIYWDGTVSLCCLDTNNDYPLGNILETGLYKIWNLEKIKKIRKLHLKKCGGEFFLCKECNIYKPGRLIVFGSLFFHDLTIKKLLPKYEKLLIMKGNY